MSIDCTCPDCGAEMYETYGARWQFECPSCGAKYNYDDCMERMEKYDGYSETEDIPEYCKICGGPYPDCKTSCKLFDD